MRVVKIQLTSHFLRALKTLGSSLKSVVREREAIFRKDCFDPRLKTHKLKGRLKGFWSFSLTKKHRVLFEIVEDGEVAFIDIGDHSIYQ